MLLPNVGARIRPLRSSSAMTRKPDQQLTAKTANVLKIVAPGRSLALGPNRGPCATLYPVLTHCENERILACCRDRHGPGRALHGARACLQCGTWYMSTGR